jgi:hypothetical protein
MPRAQLTRRVHAVQGMFPVMVRYLRETLAVNTDAVEWGEHGARSGRPPPLN